MLSAEAPLFIVFNVTSGSQNAARAQAVIEQELSSARRKFEFFVAQSGKDVETLALRAAERAERDSGAVIAVGGDGTINAAARAALPTGRPLGIIPQGTFNYTTRTHGIPADTRDATLALLNAHTVPMQVGLINERAFLVNAGVGLHPELLEDREEYKSRFGRYRTVAFAAGLSTLLREHRQLSLEIEHDREHEVVRTPSLFVGNNALQFAQTGLEQAEAALEHRRLAAVLVRRVSSWSLVALALRGALGHLSEDTHIRAFGFKRLVVNPLGRTRRSGLKVAADGEVFTLRPPLVFKVSPRTLPLLVPKDPPKES